MYLSIPCDLLKLCFVSSCDQFGLKLQELMDFLNKAPIAMHWLSGTGHVLWANETELNVLGYTAEEYIGQAATASI